MNTTTSTYSPTTAADTAKRMVDKSAEAAQDALNTTRRAANRTLDGLADGVDNARNAAVPAVQSAARATEQIGEQTLGMVRHGAQQLRERAQHATDATVVYVRQEPIKSLLMAAAAGAALVAISSLFRSSRYGAH